MKLCGSREHFGSDYSGFHYVSPGLLAYSLGNGDIPLEFKDEITAHQRPHRARQILRLASKFRTALAYQVYVRQGNRDKYVCDY